MNAEKTPASPSSDETTSQKQDPLERRRLQNRLSQRNHRRKIRDRIAKLQERVIANELRAAAALNGWDQQFTPSPLAPTFHASHHNHDPERSFLKSSTPMNTDPTMPFMPSFSLSPASSWSSDMTVPLSPTFMPGDSLCFPGGSAGLYDMMSTNPVSSLQSEIGPHSSMDNMLDTNTFHDIVAAGTSLFSERLNSSGNQPLCYAATEASLPHIIQVLSNMSPQFKIIVLVTPDATSASTAAYPSPTPTLTETRGLDMYQPLQSTSSNGLCPCQAQNAHGILGAQMGSKSWMTPGSHKSGHSPRKNFHAESGRLYSTEG